MIKVGVNRADYITNGEQQRFKIRVLFSIEEGRVVNPVKEKVGPDGQAECLSCKENYV